MQQINVALFQWLAAGHAPSGSLLWAAGLIVASASWICVAMLGLAAWRQPAQRSYAMATLFAAGAAALCAHALAHAIDLPRPFASGLSPNYGSHGNRGSLPSAHASVMFTVAAMLWLRPALRRIGIAVVGLALLMGWARIYMGMHFPLDVVAGLVLGVAIAVVCRALEMGIERAAAWDASGGESPSRVAAEAHLREARVNSVGPSSYTAPAS